MSDVLTSEQRRRNMQAIRSRDTAPEMVVRRIIHRLGYRFRLHQKALPGHPDIVLPRLRRVVLVHGCFWHQHKSCRHATRPATRAEFWATKLDGNVRRDARVRRKLRTMGWKVLVVWECQTRKPEALASRLQSFLASTDSGHRQRDG